MTAIKSLTLVVAAIVGLFAGLSSATPPAPTVACCDGSCCGDDCSACCGDNCATGCADKGVAGAACCGDDCTGCPACAIDCAACCGSGCCEAKAAPACCSKK